MIFGKYHFEFEIGFWVWDQINDRYTIWKILVCAFDQSLIFGYFYEKEIICGMNGWYVSCHCVETGSKCGSSEVNSY